MPTPRVALSVGFACLLIGLEASPAFARQTRPAVEVAGQVSMLGAASTVPAASIAPAATATLVWNTPAAISFEAQASWSPRDLPPRYQLQGGETIAASAGVRGTFLRTQRARVYGVLLAGPVHFTNALTNTTSEVVPFGGATHFALTYGAGLAVAVSRTVSAVADANFSVYSAPSDPRTLDTTPGGHAVTPSEVDSSFTFSVGLAYGLGSKTVLSPDEAAPAGRLVVGPEIGMVTSAPPLSLVRENQAAYGGFVAYRVSPHVWATGSLGGVHRPSAVVSTVEGGHAMEALGGLRLGLERRRVGIFAKIGAGALRESRTLRSMTAFVPTFGPAEMAVVDFGGVLEIYTTPHTLVHVDAGDPQTFWRGTTIVDGSLAKVSSPWADNIQISVGFGWRR